MNTPSVAECLQICGSDKVSVHSYGDFYNRLFADIRPEKLLEIGGLRGDSMRAWRMAFPLIQSIVIDQNQITNEDTVICKTPDFWPAIRRFCHEPQFDIIIDDGSHRIGCQVSGANNLWEFLRVGGVYVIEDLQSMEAQIYFKNHGWTIEDLRMNKQRYDDVIAWKVKQQ